MFNVRLVLLGCFALTHASIPVVNIAVSDLLTMQHGMGWPYVLQLMEGQDALIYLRSITPDDNLQSCHLISPVGERINMNSLSNSNKYEKWHQGCGVRIKAIVKKDEGRWRLTATNSSRTFTGWSQVHVYNDISHYRAPDIALEDGQQTTVHLSSLANSYCFVEQPFSEGSLVAGQCEVGLPRATRAVQGTWNVFLGIPGRVQEVHVERQVNVRSESIDAGYIHDRTSNKLHLHCNLMHSAKDITFCRFQRTTSSSGFNVLDGLSDGSHSYYGNGIRNNECGMTIEHPVNDDFGTWRCSIGTHIMVGVHYVDQPPMQALISIANGAHSPTKVERIAHEHEDTTTVFVEENNPFTLQCGKDTFRLRYCWFQHPNGTQYTPVQTGNREETSDLEFWYAGESLQSGDCGITFKRATSGDSGEWICHMGALEEHGIENTDKINVKVTGALAANRNTVTTKIGATAHLFCHTSNGNKPLEYCRFLSPNFVGINIDPIVTEENAIDEHYYFTPGRELNQGDCSLTIKSVRQQDLGPWTCAALIIDNTLEARDIINLDTDGLTQPARSLSQASIVGMSIGFAILVTGLAGFLVYKRFGPPSQWRTNSASQRGILSMSDATSRASNGSSSSEDTVTNVPNIHTQSDQFSVNSFTSDSTITTVRFTANSNVITVG